MEDYLSIRDFSRFSGVPSTTLRYWDEIGLFPPAKRDPETNYRYYAPEQIITINFVVVLSELETPFKTIDSIRDERHPEAIIKLINQQEKVLNMEMRRLRERYSIIHARRELIDHGMHVEDVDKISVEYRDDKAFIIGPPNTFPENGKFYEPFLNFCDQAEELRINLKYPISGYHDSMENFLAAPGQPDYFVSLDPTGNRTRVPGEYLVGYHRGYYGQFGDLPQRMTDYAKKHSLTFKGPVYAIYLHDEVCIKDPSQYLVQVCVAVSK